MSNRRARMPIEALIDRATGFKPQPTVADIEAAYAALVEALVPVCGNVGTLATLLDEHPELAGAHQIHAESALVGLGTMAQAIFALGALLEPYVSPGAPKSTK